MKKHRFGYIKNNFLPILLFSLITGIFTGIIIFAFKIASSAIIALSEEIFSLVRANPVFIPLLVLGAGVLGVLSWLIIRFAPDCRGGGIPTAIFALRGHMPVTKRIVLPLTFVSSLLTYLCGIPLGTEGPSVQMGTLMGGVTSHMLGEKRKAWRRYVMTGGACAGFAAATGAPFTGIFFAFEEAHRRFTPMIFMSASLTVVASTAVMELLCRITGVSRGLFSFSIDVIMGVEHMWSAFVIGIVCGVVAIFFTKAYRIIGDKLGKLISRIPFIVRIVTIFVLVALVGVALADSLGTGHHLIDELIEGEGIWYFLILLFLVRALLLMLSTTQGVTGGLFIPTLAFGAMIGALCGRGMIAMGILPEEYYVIAVIVGIASFLSAASRVPLTALAFSLEALAGLTNFLPVVIGVAVSFAVIEITGVESFSEAVVETKIANRNRGREVFEAEVELVVQREAFVIGHEVRDILWPPNCIIVSVIKNPDSTEHHAGLSEGDLLCVHYRTSYPEQTERQLEDLVGKQE